MEVREEGMEVQEEAAPNLLHFPKRVSKPKDQQLITNLHACVWAVSSCTSPYR